MKNAMKKLGLSLCLLASLGLAAGCGNNNAQEGQTQQQAPEATDNGAAETVTLGIVQFADHGSLDNCRVGFIEGLKQGGFEEGKNLKIEYNNAQADTGTAGQIANQYASNNVDMICAIATPAAQAAFNAAEEKKIPVIYTAVSDPIEAQLANSDRISGKNTTGTSDELPLEKQVEMIRAFLPEAKTIGILYSTSEVNSESQIAKLEPIAEQYGFTLETVGINTQADIPMAVDNLLTKVDCINNLTDNTVVSSLGVIVEKATAKGIPVFGSEIEQVKNGCVASESIDYVKLGIQTGKMAAKVLNGEDITAMPFEVVEDFEPVINSEALEALGIALPESISNAVDVCAEEESENA